MESEKGYVPSDEAGGKDKKFPLYENSEGKEPMLGDYLKPGFYELRKDSAWLDNLDEQNKEKELERIENFVMRVYESPVKEWTPEEIKEHVSAGMWSENELRDGHVEYWEKILVRDPEPGEEPDEEDYIECCPFCGNAGSGPAREGWPGPICPNCTASTQVVEVISRENAEKEIQENK